MPRRAHTHSAEKVRFSRDGDQFHYSWAARRCLKLLSSASGLVAITIEGTSVADVTRKGVDAGTEVIDVAEYSGSEDPLAATSIRYVQLKHSTVKLGLPWPPGGLQKTLAGFAKRYVALTTGSTAKTPTVVQFSFVSNRPIGSDLTQTIEDAARGRRSRHPRVLKKLQTFTKLKGAQFSSFCRCLHLLGDEDNFLMQRLALAEDTRTYLPGDDADAPVQLKELVTRKATSEFTTNPTIRKTDVLRALGTTEDRLFPAPSRMELGERSILRLQERDLAAAIINSGGTVVVHAEGGVGKSIFSQRLKHLLPTGSVHVVYDCFGHGDYRRPGSPRHRHKDALVQIANELASRSLCDPLVPSSRADTSDYLKAFAHRLTQAAQSATSANKGALVCICVDAADNAEMAAREFGSERSFVRDLIRERATSGVRLVFLCRTERQDHLDPPAGTLALELRPFEVEETAALLRRQFPSASEQDVAEFHRLTSRNPRVQATALAQTGSINQILLSLGPNPKDVDATIARLLEQAVAQTREKLGAEGALHVDVLCAALAVLRPLVPIDVLAQVSGTSAAAVRSFASDIGRPLLVTDDAVQFRDEPVETWFRTRFKAAPASLASFITRLRPLASQSAYVASTLPQLLLEDGRLDELVELALSSTDLPANNPIERRDIELQRLQFALRASLRKKHFVAAAKLAFKAGGEMTGDARQRKLFQENTDLIAVFLEPERVRDLASRRIFGAAWLGSHHAYDAALLSSCPAFLGDARSSLRMAEEWLRNWSRQADAQREEEQVTDDDIVALAMAHLNIHGPEAAAKSLSGWRPREVSFRAGRLLARRLADHGRWSDLDAVAIKAKSDAWLVLAICLEAHTFNRTIPNKTVEAAVRVLSNPRIIVEENNHFGSGEVLEAVVALVSMAATYGIGSTDDLAALLSRYLPDNPPRTLASRHGGERRSVIAGYCLRAALLKTSLDIKDIADPDLAKELADPKAGGDSSHRRDFFELVGSVLPWHRLRIDVLLNRVTADGLATRIGEAATQAASAIGSSYHEYAPTIDEVARLWLDVLVRSSRGDLIHGLTDWVKSRNRPLFTPTLTQLARVCARTPSFEANAFAFAKQAYAVTSEAREDAESQAVAYLDLARAIFVVDRAEGSEYFARSVSIAGKIGDEIIDRWTAVLDLAERAARPEPVPALAYELSRCTEVAYRYFARDKHFDWTRTISAIASLCPNSSLAVLSRWRDRGFGSRDRLLPMVLDSLLDNGAIDPVAASTLVGFRADWRYASFLRKCIGAVDNQHIKQAIFDRVLRYMELDVQSAGTWKNVKALAAEHRLHARDVNEWIAFAQNAEKAPSRAESPPWASQQVNATPDHVHWPDVFRGLALHSPLDIAEAYKRFKAFDPPFHHERFFERLCAAVDVGRETECINAVGGIPEFDLYDYKHFFESIPATWLDRLAVRSALSTLAIDLFRRHSLDVVRSRYYERLPFALVARVTGLNQEALIDATLSALGETTTPFEAGRLFTLAGLLAPRLSHEEAIEALWYSLKQFDDVMQPEDGDGVWSSQLEPPQDTATSLAGYLFASLAAPTPDTRWEAAHVVRGLCALGCHPVVSSLVAFATSGSLNAFRDAGLHFYDFHGRQWLLVALDRAASESPRNVGPYAESLFYFAQSEHVLMRHFAASAIVALADSGEILLDAAMRTRLLNINRPVVPRVSSKRWKRLPPKTPNPQDRNERFSFDYDLAKYSLDSLSAAFAMYKSDLEDAADAILRNEWRISYSGRWDDDARAKRGLLREHRHDSDRPKPESLDRYLSYHLMMTVAARLQATAAPHQDPSDDEDEYADWLSRFLLARDDGRWLADRRDPTPREWPIWKSEKADEKQWRWSVSSSDFDRALGTSDDAVNVWSSWTSVQGRRSETVHVWTALVSTSRAPALVRALQTADDPHFYRIPMASDDGEIDQGSYRLRGWINGHSGVSGLDDTDPWAGRISYPCPKPAEYVRELLGLRADEDFRTWRAAGESDAATASCQVWASQESESMFDSEGDHGSRLVVRRTTLTNLLSQLQMSLIAEVSIRRRIRHYRHESAGGDDYSVPPYFKIFLFTPDGEFKTLRDCR